MAATGSAGAAALGRRIARIDRRGLVFAAFLTAGHFKGDPRLAWLPVDLTLLLALVVAAETLRHLVRGGLRVPVGALWVSLLFVLFTVPLPWMEWHPYALEKTTRLFSLTLLAALAPFALFRGPEGARGFVRALVLLGWLMALDGVAGLLGGEAGTGRLRAFTATPIALGRDAGVPLIWAAVRWLEGRLAAPLAAAAVLVPGFALLASGSRGPLLAAVGALLTLALPRHGGTGPLPRRLAAGLLIGVMALGYAVQALPEQASRRVVDFAEGDLGASGRTRLEAYGLAWRHALNAPLGIGWGGFASEVDPTGEGGAVRQYPHNILLETLLEGGWAAGALLGGLIVAALLRLQADPAGRVPLALLVFFAINALVSGDLNDNRPLLAFVGVGLARGRRGAQAGAGLDR